MRLCLFHFFILTVLLLYLEYSSPKSFQLLYVAIFTNQSYFARHHSVVWPHLIDGLSPAPLPFKSQYQVSTLLYFCNTVSSDFRLFHENLEGSDDPDLTWRPPLPHWRTGNVPPPTIQRLLPPNTKIPIGIQTSIFPDWFLQVQKYTV